MDRESTHTLVFGADSTVADVDVMRKLCGDMSKLICHKRFGLADVYVVHYEAVTTTGLVVEKTTWVNISSLFDVSDSDCLRTNLLTYKGLVAEDLLRMLREKFDWSGIYLKVTLRLIGSKPESK